MNHEDIELKNVKIHHDLSEETLCYTASVYVRGKRAFTAENRGNGGPDLYRHVSAEGKKLLEEAEAWAKTLPPTEYPASDGIEAFTVESDLESVIGDLLATWQKEAEMKRWCKRNVVFRFAGDPEGQFRTVPHKGNPPAAIQWVQTKYADVDGLEIMNLRFA